MIPNYGMPTHVRGLIEFDGKHIPVIDPSVQLCNEPTKLTDSSCILIIEHQKLHTGIVIKDIEEVMKLAAGYFESKANLGASINMHFILDINNNIQANELLAKNHRISNHLNEPKTDEDLIRLEAVIA